MSGILSLAVFLSMIFSAVNAEEAPIVVGDNGIIAVVEVIHQSGASEAIEILKSDTTIDDENIFNFLEYLYRYDTDIREIVSINGVAVIDTKYSEFSGVIRAVIKEEGVDIVLNNDSLIDKGGNVSVPGGTVAKGPVAPIITEDVKIIINGEAFIGNAKAFITNGRTYLPFRALFEKLGTKDIGYRQYKKSMIVWGFYNGTKIEMASNSNKAFVNGTPYMMDVPVIIKNSFTYIPLKYVSEFIGARVEWDAPNKTVSVFTK